MIRLLITRARCSAILVLSAVTAMVTTAVFAQGNDFVVGELRVDVSEVYSSGDYGVLLLANGQPAEGGGYTVGWLGLDLAEYTGELYSAQFSQVGLLTNESGLYWFVYAEPGVTCLRGDSVPGWGTCNGRPCGCQGDANDLVALGSFHWVELVTYGQGYWIARVHTSSQVGYDVAKIWSDSPRIYRASSTSEEVYSDPQDPFLHASFYHWHPQYMVWGSGFQEWPESAGGQRSFIWVTDLNGQTDFCPDHYGADPNMWGDERAWYAGSGGQRCSWLLFPSAHAYLPAVLKNYP